MTKNTVDVVVDTTNYFYGQKRIQIVTKEKVTRLFGKLYPDILGQC